MSTPAIYNTLRALFGSHRAVAKELNIHENYYYQVRVGIFPGGEDLHAKIVQLLEDVTKERSEIEKTIEAVRTNTPHSPVTTE